jgi:hypothetical protein
MVGGQLLLSLPNLERECSPQGIHRTFDDVPNPQPIPASLRFILAQQNEVVKLFYS